MELTEENKKSIDSLLYESLLRRWRCAPCGDEWFQGETGDYWGKRMREMKDKIGHDAAVAISKSIGH